jgi:hypothetical protein
MESKSKFFLSLLRLCSQALQRRKATTKSSESVKSSVNDVNEVNENKVQQIIQPKKRASAKKKALDEALLPLRPSKLNMPIVKATKRSASDANVDSEASPLAKRVHSAPAATTTTATVDDNEKPKTTNNKKKTPANAKAKSSRKKPTEAEANRNLEISKIMQQISRNEILPAWRQKRTRINSNLDLLAQLSAEVRKKVVRSAGEPDNEMGWGWYDEVTGAKVYEQPNLGVKAVDEDGKGVEEKEDEDMMGGDEWVEEYLEAERVVLKGGK